MPLNMARPELYKSQKYYQRKLSNFHLQIHKCWWFWVQLEMLSSTDIKNRRQISSASIDKTTNHIHYSYTWNVNTCDIAWETVRPAIRYLAVQEKRLSFQFHAKMFGQSCALFFFNSTALKMAKTFWPFCVQ